jgi:AcrR family transcriptional regulator
MGVKERRERERIETRDKILEAARDLFLSEGYDGVTMRKVAERIEYSPTAIYFHFADKEALFRELCYQDFARLAAVFQSRPLAADPIERLKQAGQIYIDFGLHYPNHYKLMFMTPHPEGELDERERAIKGNPEVDSYAFLKQTVEQAIATGVFREKFQDAELVAQTLWAAVHGVISLEIAKHCDQWVEWRPIEKRTDGMLDSVLRGMLKEN